jgi:hypothetical protein
MELMDEDDGKWHLDKKVPMGLMIGLALNLILGIWYASKLDSRVSYLENDGERTAKAVENLRDTIEGAEGIRSKVQELKGNTDSILSIVRRFEDRPNVGPDRGH